MKYKINILLSEKHKFITMIPLQQKKHTHYLLKTNANELLIEPYLNIENEFIQMGREIASILLLKQNDEVEIEPFTDEIHALDTLHIKVKEFFDHKKIDSLSYINSLATMHFEIDLGDKYYKIDNTKILYSNCDLKRVYGHESDIKNLQKLIYGSLFCNDEYNDCNLQQNNVLIVNGHRKLKKKDIMHNVARLLNVNFYYMPEEISTFLSENLMIVYEFDESDIYTSINNVKKHGHKNVLFVFLVNDEEHKEKLMGYFDTNLSYDIQVPVAKRDGALIKELLVGIPHKINEKEMRALCQLLNKKNLFEIEDITTRVLSKANYERKCDMKMGGYFVIYKDFVDVMDKYWKVESKGKIAAFLNWCTSSFL